MGVNCTIEKNKIMSYGTHELQSGNGIHCWKSDSMKIIANTISGHRDGIYFEFVTNSVIWRNDSHNNIRYGLHFMFSNNDAYITNIFQRNGAGVAVTYSHGVKMFHNFSKRIGVMRPMVSCWRRFRTVISMETILSKTPAVFLWRAPAGFALKRMNSEAMVGEWSIQASCMDNVIDSNNFRANTFDVGTNGTLVLNSFDYNYWDKYEGYDLDKDNIGDIPYRPVSLYSMIVEKNPTAMMLFRSFMTSLLDRSEKSCPHLRRKVWKIITLSWNPCIYDHRQ